MEHPKPKTIPTAERKNNDLITVFGETGANKLKAQIAHDIPSLSEDEVTDHAWALISEATAYMHPATFEDLTENAINIHEGYEAYRRIEG